MKKAIKLVVILCLTLVCVSCATVKDTDIYALNKDGSPVWTTTAPVAKKTIYGIGKAKLNTEGNSKLAAEAIARVDLASKIKATVKEYSTYYSNDTESSAVTAFEQLALNLIDITLSNISTEQVWTAPDGTVWVLMSYPKDDLERILSDNSK